jgi:hypothetical protein
MIPGETVQSMLPFDIPWWLPDHTVFFGTLYAVLGVIGLGLGIVVLRSLAQTMADKQH